MPPLIDYVKQGLVNLLGLSFVRENKLDHRYHEVKTALPVYVTLSTIPPRLDNAVRIIAHMLEHVQGIEKVFMNVPFRYERFPDQELDLRKHQAYIRKKGPSCDRLLINRCKDYGPLTKFLPTLALIPDECILIIIDDMSYQLDAIKHIAERQQSELDKAFSYYVYPYSPAGIEGPVIQVPQGADMISMYGRNTNGFPGWFRRFLASLSLTEESYAQSPCFFTDDLLLGYYFQLEGIALQQAFPEHRDIYIPHCAVSPSKFNLNRQKGERSRDVVMARCYESLLRAESGH
jgi:hypothetical protein